MTTKPDKTLLRPRYDHRSSSWQIFYQRHSLDGDSHKAIVGWCKFSNKSFADRTAAENHIQTCYIDVWPEKYDLG